MFREIYSQVIFNGSSKNIEKLDLFFLGFIFDFLLKMKLEYFDVKKI